jgi:hypothetical protein
MKILAQRKVFGSKLNLDLINYCLLAIVSFFLVADLFINPGRSITFDGQIHMTTMAQFALALRSGDFPVEWTNNFANYGLPLGILSHQTTAYLGAGLILITNQVVLSYNLIMFMGAVISVLLCYHFLRYYFSPFAALAGSFLFNFSPYRIGNIYIRGALPELCASVFVWLALIGLYHFFGQAHWRGWLLFTLSLALLLLTHPMMLLITSLVFLPYAAILQITKLQRICSQRQPLANFYRVTQILLIHLGQLCAGAVLALLISAYYTLPLLTEIKYFYQGLDAQHFFGGSFLNISNFVSPEYWLYFSPTEIGPRSVLQTLGSAEIILIGVGVAASLLTALQKVFTKKAWPEHTEVLFYALTIFSLSLLMMLPISSFIYQHFNTLGNIQFAWRFLSAAIFAAPIVVAWICEQLPHKQIMVSLLLIIIALNRFPQLYGKNFFSYSENSYFFTPYNLYTTNLNPVWTGASQGYPIKTKQFAIIDGNGQIVSSEVKNSQRKYTVDNTNQVRMVDYTFYFPGWTVLVDKQAVLIEFQDPNYRGVITYTVPAGKHQIEVIYQNTKIRQLAQIATVLGIFTFVLIILVGNRLLVLVRIGSSRLLNLAQLLHR